MKKNTIMLNIRLIPCAAHILTYLSEEEKDLMVDLFLDAMDYGSCRTFFSHPGFSISNIGKRTARTSILQRQNVKSKIYIRLSLFQRIRKYISKGYSVSWIIQEAIYYYTRKNLQKPLSSKAA